MPRAGRRDGYDAEAQAELVRGQMLARADQLRSFPPVMFGVLDDEDDPIEFATAPEDAKLAAGALVYATDILVDELFQDVQTLAEEDTTAAECDSPLWHFEDLPSDTPCSTTLVSLAASW
ncbi:hypothetical protein [Streptomyces sp. NPDC001661]